jgi:hypothetical protein
MSVVLTHILIGLSGLSLFVALTALWQSFRSISRELSTPRHSFRDEAEALVKEHLDAAETVEAEGGGEQ